MREVMALVSHPAGGLLLDTYHLGRSGAQPRELEDVALSEIAYVQYSDVPSERARAGQGPRPAAAGQRQRAVQGDLPRDRRQGLCGPFSYEAPNPQAWARPAEDVAREALAATRAVLP